MPATKNIHMFGHRGDPGVEIGLPYELENGEVFPCHKYQDFVPQMLSLVLLIT